MLRNSSDSEKRGKICWCGLLGDGLVTLVTLSEECVCEGVWESAYVLRLPYALPPVLAVKTLLSISWGGDLFWGQQRNRDHQHICVLPPPPSPNHPFFQTWSGGSLASSLCSSWPRSRTSSLPAWPRRRSTWRPGSADPAPWCLWSQRCPRRSCPENCCCPPWSAAGSISQTFSPEPPCSTGQNKERNLFLKMFRQSYI